MRAAIYLRVSTRSQGEEGTSLDTQEDECLRFANERGCEVPSDLIYREVASGADSNRPLLSQVRQLAREGHIDCLIVYQPDRLSRDATDLMVISDEIMQAGTELHFVHGPSGNSPEDKLMRFIFGYKGEAERRDILERTMRGKRRTASEGRLPTGTGKGLYGYRFQWAVDDQSGRPKLRGREIIEDEAQVVRHIFDMAVSGSSVYNIATVLNEQGMPTKTGAKWHPRTIRNLLSNQGYMGATYYGKERVRKRKNSTKRERSRVPADEWVLVEGFTPPIVTEEVFGLAQARLSEPKARSGKALQPYLLSGHLVCRECNTPIVGTTLNRKYRYYRCRGTYATATAPRYCSARYVRADKLEEAVWGAVHEVLEHPDLVLAEICRLNEVEATPIDEEIAHLRRQIKGCKNQELRLVKLYQFGEVDDEWIRMQSGTTKLRREQHEGELERLEEQKINLAELRTTQKNLRDFCDRVKVNLDGLDFGEKRTALRALQIKAAVTGDEVHVSGILGVEPDLATTARTSA